MDNGIYRLYLFTRAVFELVRKWTQVLAGDVSTANRNYSLPISIMGVV